MESVIGEILKEGRCQNLRHYGGLWGGFARGKNGIIVSKGITMRSITVEIQIPEALRELGISDEEIRREVPILLVLKRFRQGHISSGKAAQLLGISRRDFLELLAKERIPVYDPDEQQLAEEFETIRRLTSSSS
jgi:predicted HTH domain antitoxin